MEWYQPQPWIEPRVFYHHPADRPWGTCQVPTGQHRVSCFPHLRPIGLPLHSMESSMKARPSPCPMTTAETAVVMGMWRCSPLYQAFPFDKPRSIEGSNKPATALMQSRGKCTKKRPLCEPHGMLAYGPASGVEKPVPANYVELSRRVAGYSALIQRHIHCAPEAHVSTWDLRVC